MPSERMLMHMCDGMRYCAYALLPGEEWVLYLYTQKSSVPSKSSCRG